MIKNLYLKNFRCFRDLKLEDLGKITIISGENNIGKTALLESIFLAYGYDLPDIFYRINSLRNIQFSTFVPDIIWNHLFYRNNLKNKIEIKINSRNNFKLTFEIDDRYQLSQLFPSTFNGTQGNTTIQSLQNPFIHNTPIGSPMKIVYEGEFEDQGKGEIVRTGYFVPTQNSFVVNWDKPRQQDLIQVVQYIGPGTDNAIKIAKQFGNLEKNGKKPLLVRALRQLDPNLEDVVVIMDDSPRIYAYRKNSPLLPLEVLGNGMMRILQIICAMLQKSDLIVLIDEIETGFHHDFLKKFWNIIEEISNESNLQLIVTTHSYECLQAASQSLSSDFQFKYIRLEEYNDDIETCLFTLDELKVSLGYNMEV